MKRFALALLLLLHGAAASATDETDWEYNHDKEQYWKLNEERGFLCLVTVVPDTNNTQIQLQVIDAEGTFVQDLLGHWVDHIYVIKTEEGNVSNFKFYCGLPPGLQVDAEYVTFK